MEVVFNGCWVFRDAKCGICKPKLVIYKPYWAVRRSASATTTDSQELRYSILGGKVTGGLKGEQYGISWQENPHGEIPNPHPVIPYKVLIHNM